MCQEFSTLQYKVFQKANIRAQHKEYIFNRLLRVTWGGKTWSLPHPFPAKFCFVLLASLRLGDNRYLNCSRASDWECVRDQVRSHSARWCAASSKETQSSCKTKEYFACTDKHPAQIHPTAKKITLNEQGLSNKLSSVSSKLHPELCKGRDSTPGNL